ncbi:MAG: hypothetical protein RR764_11415 [Oscillospiraceae bacterium]
MRNAIALQNPNGRSRATAPTEGVEHSYSAINPPLRAVAIARATNSG